MAYSIPDGDFQKKILATISGVGLDFDGVQSTGPQGDRPITNDMLPPIRTRRKSAAKPFDPEAEPDYEAMALRTTRGAMSILGRLHTGRAG